MSIVLMFSIVVMFGWPEQAKTAETTSHVEETTHEPATPDKSRAEHGSWSNDGESAPAHGGDPNKEYAMCKDGQSQSPIDIKVDDVEKVDLPPIAFHYLPAKPQVVNNGYTIQVNYPEGSYITIGEVPYNLLQFHFHTLSEHTINGVYYPLEVHFVHQSTEDVLAVVGIMLDEGAENEVLKPIFANLPKTAEATFDVPETIDLAAVLPEKRQTYRYDGSLTTPPCTEGVKWNLFVDPIELSVEQISAFTAIYDHNFRPIQPLNGRKVYISQ